MKLDDHLDGVTILGLDTSVFIYFVEMNLTYLDVIRDVIRRIDSGVLVGRASSIALTEVLTKPLKDGDFAVVRNYKSVLSHSRNFALVPVDDVVAIRAADLRARFNLRTADALHLACAIEAGCEAYERLRF